MKVVGKVTLRSDIEMRETACPFKSDRNPFGGERKETRCGGTDCNACWGVAGQQTDGNTLYYCARCK